MMNIKTEYGSVLGNTYDTRKTVWSAQYIIPRAY